MYRGPGILDGLYSGLRVLRLCGFATVALVTVGLFFIWNDQGADFLRILAEPASIATRITFFTSVVAWSLATWYSTRLLVIRQLPGSPLPSEGTKLHRVWMPRVLGALAPLSIAVGFARLASSGGQFAAALWWAAGMYAVLTGVLLTFYWKRREWFPGVFGGVTADACLAALPHVSVVIVSAALGASFALLVLFLLLPVGAPRLLGAPAIFVSAGAAILLFGSIVLTYAPLAAGRPTLTLPVLVIAVLVSGMNDNHVIRTAIAPAGVQTLVRQTPQKHFDAWLSGARAASSQSDPGSSPAGNRQPYPVFIVAAAGGGIRAAYWTALVLGTAADRVGASAWRRHLYALSAVSGGSLGAAVHVVELATDGSPANVAERAEGMLAEDHLSPVTAFMLYPDLLQRFLPFPIAAFDRARALEMSWEKSAHDVLGAQAFSEPFGSLWSGRYHSMPALLLNSTRVETGQRAIVSSLELSNDFLDAVDLLQRPANGKPDASGYPLRSFDSLRLSTAVHLSARFTYVSPAARVENAQGKLWGRLVDGGYFENSGTATAADLVRALYLDWDSIQDASEESHDPAFVPPAVPIVLLIKNDPHAPSICSAHVDPKESQSQLLTEVKAPVDALLATREARGRLSEREIIRTVDGPGALPENCDRGCILEFSLARTATTQGENQQTAAQQLFTDPPLGWSLSEASRQAIKSRIGEHEREFRCIDDLIRTGQCTSPTTCGQ